MIRYFVNGVPSILLYVNVFNSYCIIGMYVSPDNNFNVTFVFPSELSKSILFKYTSSNII